MAQEISLTAGLSARVPPFVANRRVKTVGENVTDLKIDWTTKVWTEGTMTASTAPGPIPLGDVSQPHWAYFRNRDSTNFFTIQSGADGAPLLELGPGEEGPTYLYRNCTPYAVADTASVQFDYLILSK